MNKISDVHPRAEGKIFVVLFSHFSLYIGMNRDMGAWSVNYHYLSGHSLIFARNCQLWMIFNLKTGKKIIWMKIPIFIRALSMKSSLYYLVTFHGVVGLSKGCWGLSHIKPYFLDLSSKYQFRIACQIKVWKKRIN